MIPFHTLGYSYAALLIATHQDIKTVQSRLGHVEASTTMNIYAHALRESEQKASSAVESALTHA